MPINSSGFISEITLSSQEEVQRLFQLFLAKLDSGGYPQGDGTRTPPTYSIQSALKVSPTIKVGDSFITLISVDIGKAPYALAFEYGSGVHGEAGATYEIRPKNAPVLAFYWDKFPSGTGKKFIGYGKDGRHMFNYVDHPGIAAKPWIRPVIEQYTKDRSRIKERFFRAVRTLFGKEKEFKVVIAL